MKKIIFAIVFISLSLSLAACSASATSTSSTQADSLSQETQLLLGTLKLDSTDNAVTAEQAATLLPLWETLQSMSASGTGATAEVEALVAQIQAGMTAGQMAAISSMDLTSADLAAAMAESRASTSASTSGNSSSLPQMASNGAGPMSAPSGGNPPTDMGGGPMGASAPAGGIDVAQTASTPASGAQSSTSAVQIPASLIKELVQQLQKIIEGKK